MDILNTLLDAGKKMAGEALAQQAKEKTDQGAETFLHVFFETFSAMDATQKAALLGLFTSLASQVSSDDAGLEKIWQQFKDNQVIRDWAGTLAQEAAKRLSQQFLS